MKSTRWLLAVLLGTMCLGTLDFPLGAGEPAAWLTDLEQARRVARESGRPIFVVFRCEH